MHSSTEPDYVGAYLDHGSIRAAARALGLPYTTVHGALPAAWLRDIGTPWPPGSGRKPAAPDQDNTPRPVSLDFDDPLPPPPPAPADADGPVLVFSDAHAGRYRDDLRRFQALARLIAHRKPRAVVCLGDLAHCGTAIAAKHRGTPVVGDDFVFDLQAAARALEEVTRHYKPGRLIYLEGNHEDIARQINRSTRALPSNLVDDHLIRRAKALGWSCHRYGETVELDGVWFSHAFLGQKRKPIGGANAARDLVRQLHVSAVAGDTHRWDGPHLERGPDGRARIGLTVGAWSEHRGDDTRAWAGCALLHDLRNGEFRVEQVSLAATVRDYLERPAARPLPGRAA